MGLGNNSKFTTIHSGTELSRFTDVKVDVGNKRNELGIPADSTVIITVGRLTSEKGHTHLLDAANEVVSALGEILGEENSGR